MAQVAVSIDGVTHYRTCSRAFFFNGDLHDCPEWLQDMVVTKSVGIKGIDYGEATFNLDNRSRVLMLRGGNGYTTVYPNSIVLQHNHTDPKLRKLCKCYYEVIKLDVSNPPETDPRHG